jgi:TDG/mug DNA glycosylase family protein
MRARWCLAACRAQLLWRPASITLIRRISSGPSWRRSAALRALPYPIRLQRLEQHRIALWDVLQSCVRDGSLDSSIEAASAEPNDIPALLRSHRDITRICCNGGTSYRELLRHHGPELQRDFPHVTTLRLPSTSPAHAGMRLAQKLSAWKAAVQPAF